MLDRLAPLRRAQKFPEAASLRIALSKLGVGQQPLQPGVLLLQLLEPLGLVDLQAAVLLPPAVVRLLGDAELLADLGDRLPLASSTSASRSLAMICSA